MPPAGMEMVIARLAHKLVARGHEVGITCTEYVGDLGEALADRGFEIGLAPLPGMRTILFPHELERRLRERRPDVVHVHSGVWLKAARAAARAGVPRVIHTIHGLLDREPWHGPLLMRWAARYTDAIAAVSRPLVVYLRDVVHVPNGKVIYLPNGIDTSVFSPAKGDGRLRRHFRLSDDRFIIGHVGRFAPVKNHALLIEAFARLHARRPASFLVLIGDGDLRPEIEARIAGLGLRDHVGLYGLADDPGPLYRDLDLFVLPSLAEGTSMSLLEAMATGLPVVATRVGGNPDLVADTGILVPSGDASALADAMERVIDRPEEGRALGAAARDRIQAGYDEDGVVDRYESLYRAEPTSVLAA